MIFLDVEASGLHASSYPIEVAWCRHDLTAGWSALVRPAPAWGEDDWSPASERIHGIGRLQTQLAGLPVSEVAARLNAALAGQLVMSDHPEADSGWLWRAFVEAKASPAFTMARPLMHSQARHTEEELAQLATLDVDVLLTELAQKAGISAEHMERISAELRADAGIKPHRALDDVIGHALDLGAVALIQAACDHGDQAAATLRAELLHRAGVLLREHGRR